MLLGRRPNRLNESFNSILLKNVANSIDRAEKNLRAKGIEEYEKDLKEYEKNPESFFKSRKPNIAVYTRKQNQTFSDIFGPIDNKYKTGSPTRVKWSEISDSDFEVFTKETEYKGLKRILKSAYKDETDRVIICCEPNTKDVVFFIKGFDKGELLVYYFANNRLMIKEAPKSKWLYRYLHPDEIIALIDGLDVYVLTITSDMIDDYNFLRNERVKSQTGVINYDQDSLDKILKLQQDRYQSYVREVRKNKFENDPNIYFDKFNELQHRITNLSMRVINSSENISLRYGISKLLEYSTYAFQSLNRYLDYAVKYDKEIKRIKRDHPEDYEEVIKRYEGWSSDNWHIEDEANSAQKYLQDLEDMLDEIESEL